ncbi:hypothetical protein Pelo_13314 [Pelomyxa schiedti]|nr:hypothetical protein Pelo_13314 [Pelomyxa schiedti]
MSQAQTETAHKCAVCGATTTLRCSRCKSVHYCSSAHQKQHWPTHKKSCNSTTTTPPASSASTTPASSTTSTTASAPSCAPDGVASQWMTGVVEHKRHEWLVDCYRTRVDDDYNLGGSNSHGVYEEYATKVTVAADFAVFCLLAALRGVTPRTGWDWDATLNTAVPLLPVTFDVAAAQAKYGADCLAVPPAEGAPSSLRYTAMLAYGRRAEDGEAKEDAQMDPTETNIRYQVTKMFIETQKERRGRTFYITKGSLSSHSLAHCLAHVGGAARWEALTNKLDLSV